MGNWESALEIVGLMSMNKELADAYEDKTVFLTGHTGFKGAWLSLWLESLGARVIGYSLDPPTMPSLFDVLRLKDRIVDIRGDIQDRNTLLEQIKKYRPEYIFHLAAQPLVRLSYQNPLETFAINVIGTVNVLESIRTLRFPTTCVCITSDKCYENRGVVHAYQETDSLGGHDPYSASKGAAEIAISSYRKSFFHNEKGEPLVSLSSARAGNIIGGGDWAPDRIVPDCIRALVKGEPVVLRNPHAVRPWQYVLDPLYGYLLLGLKMQEKPREYAEAWNFGPHHGNAVDVQTLVENLLKEWGSGTWELDVHKERSPHEAAYLLLDISKSMTRLGWAPSYDINGSIQRTVEWYKEYYTQSVDITEYSLGLIKEFYRQ